MQEKRLMRMCSWNTCLTPESIDIAEVLDDPRLHVRCTLHASPEEKEEEGRWNGAGECGGAGRYRCRSGYGRRGVETDLVEGEVKASVDTEVETTVEGDQEEDVDTCVDTTVESEVEAALDTGIGTTVEGDTEKADQPRRRTTRSVRQKDVQEKPKVFLRRSKRKAVENLDIDERPQETRVKKPSQWVTSPYTTEGQWRKHIDATAFDLF
ncbi:hypothetical protein Fot_03397 [Forsythia ovata]|uniref:Uncharacterized protein n=1 Tax=Forsythia ovata TaxID=205694 RepID=A0ABD1X9L8_9LAMI